MRDSISVKTTGFKPWRSTAKGLLVLLSTVVWTGCSTMDGLEPIAEREDAGGHLMPSVPEIAAPEAIPETVESSIYLPVPEQKAPLELFTVSAADIPVEELLYSLARDAELELDVFSGVTGQVTINAIDQTLPNILKRISEQAGLVFELNDDYLVVRPDRPIWRTYEVDYLNVERAVDSQVVLNMSVSAGPGNSDEGSRGSTTQVSTKAESKFWERLESNVLAQVTSAKIERIKEQLKREEEVFYARQSRLPEPEEEESGSDGDEGDEENSEESSAESSSPAASQDITQVSADNDVVVNPESGVISVFTDTKTHKQLQAFFDRVLNRIRKEVLIEATIVEVELYDDYRSGVDWAALSQNGNFQISQSTIGKNFADVSSTTLGSATLPENLNAGSEGTFGLLGGEVAVNLQLVQRYGKTKVLSSPKIMAVNNQAALLKVVDNHVYFGLTLEREEDDDGDVEITYTSELNTVPVGLIMSVTPFISSNDEVTLSVRPTISRIIGYALDPAVQLAAAAYPNPENIRSVVPLIREREMEAVLKVRNGQTAVIGGLMQDTDDDVREGLPGVEKVPGIGDAFSYNGKNRRKSELVIFIRPIIVESPDVEHGDLKGFRQYLPGQKNTRNSGSGGF